MKFMSTEDKSDCELDKCLNSNEADWVMCSKCNRWFHCVCASVSIFKARQSTYVFSCSECK